MSKSPKEVAQGAVDRLCDYNAIGDADVNEFFEETADNVSEFLFHFIYLTALRLNEAAKHEASKGKLADIDEALKDYWDRKGL